MYSTELLNIWLFEEFSLKIISLATSLKDATLPVPKLKMPEIFLLL